MKKLFPFLLAAFLTGPVSAQILGGLDDDDFVSDLPANAAAPKPAASAPKPAASVVTAPRPAPKPAAPAPKPAVSVVTAPRPAPKPAPAPLVAGLSPDSAANGGFPSFGEGPKEMRDDLPDLGKKKAKEEEDDMSLFERRRKRSRSSEGGKDVSSYDVAGLRLKMTPEEIVETAKEKGFTLVRTEKNIPQLKEWNYKRKCLAGGNFRVSDLKDCVGKSARSEETEYTKFMLLENKAAKEKLSVNFTSKNQAFRIRYFNRGDHSLGTTEEAYFLKSKRRNDFYRALVKKYDYPDDEEALLWGGSDLGAVLSANMTDTFLDASVTLEDGEMVSKDFDDMATDDVQGAPSAEFHF